MADNTLVIKINGSAKDFLDELDKVKKQTKDTEKVLTSVAKTSAIAFAGFATAIALTTKEFAKYETALVGVGKTTNIEGKKLEAFGKQFQKLSTEIPLSTNELLGIAQAAGQLGVTGEKNLLKFTKTIAKLGVATDLTGEQAATSLTRILNVTNEGIDTIDTFGSVIVALGNNFAATESEIVKMTNEVARSTAVFGVSASQAAALGTAMKSVGIQAQLGGSVVGKAMLKINKAIDSGGPKLDTLSKLTGIAGDQLKKTFEDDATGTFEKFIQGLGGLEGGTSAIFKALESLGLKGDEVNKVLPVLAKNSALVGKALTLAAKETENATALNIEAEKAYSTLNSEKEKLLNTATNLAVKIGTELAPTIRETIVDTRVFLKSISELDTGLIKTVATFLKWGAAISGAIAGIAAFLLGAIQVSALITAIGAAFLPATFAASAFWVAVTGPIGIAIAGIAALTIGVATLYNAVNKKKEPETLIAVNKELDKLKEKQAELKKKNNFDFRNQKALTNIGKEITKLEELRQAKIKASEDFGTGSLLIRPEADTGVDLGASAFGIEQEQAIVFAPGEGPEATEDGTKGREEDKTAIVSAETQKRIDTIKAANQELQAINSARGKAVTDEEKEFAEKRAKIDFELSQAKLITNAEERAVTIENIRQTNAQTLEELATFEENKAERERIAGEKKLEAGRALDQLKAQDRALIDEEDLVALEEQILLKEEIEGAQALKKGEKEIERRNKFLEDETQFGTNFAKLNQFFRDSDIQGAKAASGQLIALTNSKNSSLKAIGKAAASVNAAIATGEGAIKAYSSLAGIPIVGPGLGIAAASALVAYGVEQQANILGANAGGRVPLNMGQAGVDSVPASLTPGEVVVPAQNYEQLINAEASARGFDNPDEEGTEGGNTMTIMLEPKGDLMDFIEQQVIERRVQGTGIL